MLIFCYVAVLIFLFSIIFQFKEMLEKERKQYKKLEEMYHKHMKQKDFLNEEIIATYENSYGYFRNRIEQLEKKLWDAEKIKNNSLN